MKGWRTGAVGTLQKLCKQDVDAGTLWSISAEDWTKLSMLDITWGQKDLLLGFDTWPHEQDLLENKIKNPKFNILGWIAALPKVSTALCIALVMNSDEYEAWKLPSHQLFPSCLI
jgi:hypothetical protein